MNFKSPAMPHFQEEEVLDVIIVGAGPCGLATAARLREHAPDALFTDEEHRRYSWIGKYGNRVALKHVKSGKKTPASQAGRRPEYKMLVLDAETDVFLGRWKRLFAAYDIQHLRSPMLWHIDPLDRDAMLAHAYRTGREDELIEIKNCVGKEVSKHAKKQKGQKNYGGRQSGRVAINLRDRNDYYTPSQALFLDHSQDVVDRYRLNDDLISQEGIQNLDYGVVRGVSCGDEKLFTVTTNKSTRYAKSVVMAVGPANSPVIPRPPSMPQTGPILQCCHSFHITANKDQYPAPIIQQRLAAKKPTNLLIIGGGLTSAQLADVAIRRGVTKVYHFLRSPLRLKHFDVDLEWMGKYKNAEQSRFWTADSDEERLEIIKQARGGGSITPLFYRERTKKHIASGRCDFRPETKLVDARFEDEGDGGGKWSITIEPADTQLPKMDYIVFATGIQTDFTKLPYLQTMIEKYPVKGFGGFPCLNEDLMWKDDVPLFMTGRLGSLQLGPAAPNIGGAKIGAERVAWAIESLIKPEGAEEWEESVGAARQSYASGHGNMYSALDEISE